MTTLSRNMLGNRFLKSAQPHNHHAKGMRRHRRFPLRKTNRLVILIFMLVLFITLFLTFLQVGAVETLME